MFCEETASYAANKALRKLGIGEAKEGAKLIDIPLSDEGYETVTGYDDDGVLRLIVGETYIIKTDSATYTDVCKPIYSGDDGSLLCTFLGDYRIGGDVPENWDGGRYAVVCGEDFISAFDVDKGRNISVFKASYPISDKYLPEGFGGGRLPVVELSTPILADGSPARFTDEENEALEKAALSGMPAVIRFPFSPDGEMAIKIACVANLMIMMEDTPVFGYRLHMNATTDFIFEGVNGQWGGAYVPTA
jgi:hypothetical protein